MSLDDAMAAAAGCARAAQVRPNREPGNAPVPGSGAALNETGAAIVRLCDGARSIDQIVEQLSTNFRGDRDALMREVVEFLDMIRARGLLQ